MAAYCNKRETAMKLDQLNHLRNDSCIEFKEETVNGEIFTVVSYTGTDAELWKKPFENDACGITVNGRGDCVCRPFEKFFKVTEDTRICNLYYNGVILTKKYDGIMITPVLVTDAVVFKSKRSFLSEVANTANRTESNKLKEFCTTLLVQGITPIFEFINPYRQIVNDYGSQHQFILIGVRRIGDGKYVDIDELVLNIISSAVIDNPAGSVNTRRMI